MRTRTFAFSLAPLLALVGSAGSAADYSVDSDHTRVTFEIDHFGFSTFRGYFHQATGRISYDPAAKTGSAEIRIPVASVTTGSAKLDRHLQSTDFFAAASHPIITFRSLSFNFDGGTLRSIDGDLTVRGASRPVKLEVLAVNCGAHPLGGFAVCGADAQVRIRRSEFGVSGFLPSVGDEVLLEIGVEAHDKSQRR